MLVHKSGPFVVLTAFLYSLVIFIHWLVGWLWVFFNSIKDTNCACSTLGKKKYHRY